MKKVLGMFLVLMVVMSIAVFADTTTYAPKDDGTYSIPYTEGVKDKYYALLVVEGVWTEDETPTISEDTVLYIDQATADANGDVSFDGWIPKNESPATVYLGGTGVAKPVLLGYLGSNNFMVSGKVSTDSGTSYEATVTLKSGEDTFTATSVNGAYSIEVPEGTYTFNVNVKNHLSYTDNDFAVSADVSGKNVSVLGGDIDNSGAVEFSDLNTVLIDYGNSTEADIDGNGTVEFADLNTILINYGQVAVVE